MTVTSVTSGVTSSGITVLSGNVLDVLSGGVALSTTVSSGGQEILSGGHASFTTVSSGGFEVVSSGGLTVSATIHSGGVDAIFSGGLGDATTIDGGAQIVFAGGAAGFGTISGVGGNQALSGGFASAMTILSGGFELIYSGGIGLGGDIVQSGGNEDVFSGGLVAKTVISAGGFETVFSGGTASGSVAVSGGTQVVSSGGLAESTVVSGGVVEVLSGGVAQDSLVSSGGEVILSGGHVSFTLVSSGAFELVSSGGLTVDATIESGGINAVFSGGLADATGIAGTEIVFSGGGAGFGTISSGGNQTLSGGGFNSAMTIDSGGIELISSGGIGLGGDVVNSGGNEDVLTGGLVVSTTISTGGFETVFSGGTATLAIVLSGGNQVVSVGGEGSATTVSSGGVQTIETGGILSSTFLLTGGAIDLPGLPFVSGGTADFDSSTNILTITVGSNVTSAVLGGTYTNEFFHLSADAGTGTLVTVNGTPCYCRGTRILTARGEVVVEDLRVGDYIFTHRGETRRIHWIGRRGYAGRFAAGNRDVLPVRIRAGALEDGVPARDLFVSPFHAMYLDDVLIPAIALVNGSSIQQLEQVDQVEYFHIELDSHDIILAEGAPSETFVDDDSRGMFHNSTEYRMLYPNSRSEPARFCAPRVEDGEILEAVRRRLAERARPAKQTAATVSTPGQDLPNTPRILKADASAAPIVVAPAATARGYEGCVDQVTHGRITGWAFDPRQPDAPVALQILDNGVLVARVLANAHRPDLEQVGIGSGWHGFDIIVPGGLSPLARHVVQIRGERDGTDLPGSPVVIEPANSFDATLQQAVANAVASVAAPGEQERVLSFILAQADRLRQQRADTDAKRSERATARKLRRRLGPDARDLAEPARRVLVIDARLPRSASDAGSQPILSHMQALRDLGYEVSLIAADEMTAPAAASTELAASGVACLGAPFYTSVEDVLRRQAECFDVIYLHRAEIATRYLTLARTCCPRARIVYAVGDLHHVRLERQAAIEERPELLAESRRMRLMECTSAWLADAVITHSAAEAALLRELVPEANVHQAGWEGDTVASALGAAVEQIGLAARPGVRGTNALAG